MRYIDGATGNALAEDVGRCNRSVNCGYHLTPKQFFENVAVPEVGKMKRQKNQVAIAGNPQERFSTIPMEVFRSSLGGNQENYFVEYLDTLFDRETINGLLRRFLIGTSSHWNGATVFWQVDQELRIHTGKIMLYDARTGRRVKRMRSDGSTFSHITWVHTVMTKGKQTDEFKLKQCLFGEHQLKSNDKPVAIVESEKTAVIASVYLPGFVWLACGGLSNLSPESCHMLTGRTVVLFPDLSGFESWSAKAQQLRALGGLRVSVSNLLEQKADPMERSQGLDLADYLVRYHPTGRQPMARIDATIDEYLERAALLEFDAGFERRASEEMAWREMFHNQSRCPVSELNPTGTIRSAIASLLPLEESRWRS